MQFSTFLSKQRNFEIRHFKQKYKNIVIHLTNYGFTQSHTKKKRVLIFEIKNIYIRSTVNNNAKKNFF